MPANEDSVSGRGWRVPANGDSACGLGWMEAANEDSVSRHCHCRGCWEGSAGAAGAPLNKKNIFCYNNNQHNTTTTTNML